MKDSLGTSTEFRIIVRESLDKGTEETVFSLSTRSRSPQSSVHVDPSLLEREEVFSWGVKLSFEDFLVFFRFFWLLEPSLDCC